MTIPQNCFQKFFFVKSGVNKDNLKISCFINKLECEVRNGKQNKRKVWMTIIEIRTGYVFIYFLKYILSLSLFFTLFLPLSHSLGYLFYLLLLLLSLSLSHTQTHSLTHSLTHTFFDHKIL